MGSKFSKSGKKEAKAKEHKATQAVKSEATSQVSQAQDDKKQSKGKSEEKLKTKEEKPKEKEEKQTSGAQTQAKISSSLDQSALDQIFYKAHTEHGFTNQPVDISLVEKALELALLGPTSYNCSPVRIAIVSSPAGKEKLVKAVGQFAAGNVDQTTQAPINLIVCVDKLYSEKLGQLMPLVPNAGDFFKGNDSAMNLNGTLQAGYLIMALRALGLGVGPQISAPPVDSAFDLASFNWESKFIINVGYGVEEKRYPRAPRLSADSTSFDPENSAAIRK